IADQARIAFGGPPRPDLPRDDADRLREQMQDCLDARGGEVSARARAAELGRTYLALSALGRERFLRLLAEEFGVDASTVGDWCATFSRANDAIERGRAERG